MLPFLLDFVDLFLLATVPAPGVCHAPRPLAWRWMSFGPALWRPFALLAGALIAGGLGLLVPEIWALAAVLLAGAVRDAVSRPALVITPEGFHYVVRLGRAFAPWELV